jgi:signal transduction histidine kinase
LISIYFFGNTPFNLVLDDYDQLINLHNIAIVLLLVGSFLINHGDRHVKYLASKIHPLAFNFFAVFASSLLFNSLIKLLEYFVFRFKIKFDYNNVLILEWVSISSLLLILFAAALVFLASYLLFKNNSQSNFKGLLNVLVFVLAIGASLVLMWFNQYPIIPLGVFLFAYFLILELFVESHIRNITSMLWWLILYSAFISINLFYFGLKNDINQRDNILTSVYQVDKKENNDKIKVLSKEIVNLDLIYSLSQLQYPAKLNKTDFEEFAGFILEPILNNSEWEVFDLEVFDQSRESIFSNNYAEYQDYEEIFALSKQIASNIYYDPFTDSYYLRYDIDNASFEATPFNFYVGLRLKNSATKTYDNINYLVIKDDNIVKRNLDISASNININPTLVKETQIVKDISFVVRPLGDDMKIVSFRKIAGLIKPISFFSFIFSLGGLLLAFFTFLNTRFSFLPEDISIKYFAKSSLRSKIQLTIILLVVFSFIIIGFITAIYFKTVFDTNQKNTRTKEISTILSSIQSYSQGSPDIYGANEITKNKIASLANLHNVSLSFYDINGQLLKNKTDEIHDERVSFEILNHIKTEKTSYTKYDEKEGFQKTYTPLYLAKSGDIRGVLKVEYNKKDPTVRSIIDFVGTILNVYIFLFLLAGAISIAISNSITKPLSQLGDKLRQFKLGQENQSLEWSGNDEIGILINDFNNLTEELAHSAELLAKTERDTAWREMAKQVAHEIKNPLTPMKLSIQYLEKAVKADPANAEPLIKRISSTLIEQIENLSQIASEFSNFATMPTTNNEKVVLNNVVETIHDLFRKREDMEVKLHEPIEDLTVFADRNQLVRILNNLVKNAMQAIPEEKKGKIDISLVREDNKAIIMVKDNGTGIPSHMIDKVFTPNFTTKSSGTGLGLAISANMIETMNGKIYFDTIEGEGTTFYMSIPLMRYDDDEKNMVSLD